MTRVEIEVTLADITLGRRRDCDSCPVALAARRALPDRFPAVFRTILVIGAGTHIRHVRLPLAAIDFIAAFDERDPVGPFSFVIDLPE